MLPQLESHYRFSRTLLYTNWTSFTFASRVRVDGKFFSTFYQQLATEARSKCQAMCSKAKVLRSTQIN